ncbi:MAG: hypothetical protein P8Z67_14065 [Gammaproteobacteria bacterium]
MTSARVGLVMGSNSDWPVMEAAARMLEKLHIANPTRADVMCGFR